MNQTKQNPILLASLLFAAGMVIGVALSDSNSAHGQVRESPPSQVFQSGGQLSVPILKEIAATLGQMDARLARLETMAQKMQLQSTRSHDGGGN